MFVYFKNQELIINISSSMCREYTQVVMSNETVY